MTAETKTSTGLRCASCGDPAAVYDGKWFWCGECGKREVPRTLALRAWREEQRPPRRVEAGDLTWT